MFGRVAHGADFHFGGTGRDADHDLEVGSEKAVTLAVHLFDESADHHFRCIEVGDHTVAKGTYGLDPGVGTLLHQFGLLPNGDALVGIVVDGDDTRFVQHDFVILVDDGIGRSEVDCQFLIQKRKCHFRYSNN